ncbi:MAG TPA: PDZ domain-containing protein [Acidimicrobiia bacterium]
MRRTLVLLLMIGLAVTGCATRSQRSTPLLSIPTGAIGPDVNVGAGQCLLTVGPALGVEVQSVDDGSAAQGVLEVGDVITSFGGTPTLVNSALVTAVRSHQVGETVPVVVSRDGESLMLRVTLAESPTLPGTPAMGITGVTVNDQVLIDQLPDVDETFAGPLTRVVDLGDDYLVFDPVRVRWARLPGDASTDASFAVIGREIYLATLGDSGVVSVSAVSTEVPIALSTGEWQPTRLLGVLDSLLVFGAQREDTTQSSGIETAIIGVDPLTGLIQWSLTVADQSSGAFVPTNGFRDPYGDRVEIELTPVDAAVPASHVIVTPTDTGGAEGVLASGIPSTAPVIGWSGQDELLWPVEGLTSLSTTDPSNGLTGQVTLPLADMSPIGFWPVGDGTHVLVDDGSVLLLADIDGIGLRVLTEACPSPAFAEPGWSVAG